MGQRLKENVICMLILGAVLLLIASVGLLIYLWTQVPMSIPLALLLWAVVFGIFALVGGIAWLAGWLPPSVSRLVSLERNCSALSMLPSSEFKLYPKS